MKKNKWLGLALVATMASFSACTNEAEEVLAQESEIKLTSEITPSRVTSLDYQSTQIVDGQQVGVTITGAKSEHNNVAWTAGADGALNNTGDEVYYGNGSATITAYHPYNANWTGTNHTFSVNTDQSTDAGYLTSDLLWTTKTATKSEEAVALTFVHKLAKINVTLQPEYQDMDLSSAVISICNTKTSTTINLSDGTITEATGNAEEIKAGTGKTVSAIVVPQTIAASTQFIKVVLGSKTFYYTLPSAKELKSGYSHNYTLTVKETTLAITNSSEIKDWTDENENTGDANEVDFSWFNPNQYISYVSNYQQVTTNEDASKPDITRYSSYISCPSTSISKMEIKFQMVNVDNWIKYYNSLHVWSSSRILLNNDQIEVCGNKFSWNDLEVGISDIMVLSISYKDKYIKLNGTDLEHSIASDVNSYTTGGYFFSGGYSSDYDDGWLREWKAGVSEGSKLYYVKFWNENDELVYLGAASTALNPTTSEVENCWRSFFNGTTEFQFAHYSTSLTNRQPYGGGIDE